MTREPFLDALLCLAKYLENESNRWGSNKATQTLNYDYIFYDHAGAYTPVMEAALLARDEMLIPCKLEAYAVQGLFEMFEKLRDALADHTIHNSGIIPYAIDQRYAITKQYLEELQGEFNGLVLPAVRTDSNITLAQSHQQTIFEFGHRKKFGAGPPKTSEHWQHTLTRSKNMSDEETPTSKEQKQPNKKGKAGSISRYQTLGRPQTSGSPNVQELPGTQTLRSANVQTSTRLNAPQEERIRHTIYYPPELSEFGR